jgi:hypothetical protein
MTKGFVTKRFLAGQVQWQSTGSKLAQEHLEADIRVSRRSGDQCFIAHFSYATTILLSRNITIG